MAEVKIVTLEDFKTIKRFKEAGVTSRAFPASERWSIGVSEFEPGTEIEHSHVAEEISYAASGRTELIGGEQKAILETGEFVLVPSGTKHGIKVISDEKLVLISVFSPPYKI